jgi:hypothetical protein
MIKLEFKHRSGRSRKIMTFMLCFICFMCFCLSISANSAFSKDDRRSVRVKEVLAIGDNLKRAISAKDPDRILRYVRKGISCVDSFIDAKEVEKDLKDRQSRLFSKLFGADGMSEYFKKAKDQEIRVDFMEVKDKEDLDWACLRYTTSNFDEDKWPEICISFRNGKWGITDSLYDCL